ncbi:MAG: hypothetical protein AAFQ53_08425, partial [Bacteroidota bacterium]
MDFPGVEFTSISKSPPLAIADEVSVHLAHTAKRLEPEQLLVRVQEILSESEVPVDVVLAQASWKGDLGESRPRLMASLRDHSFSDIRMMLGVDYLGRWASIQMMLGVQPEGTEPWKMPRYALWCMIIGGVLTITIVAAIVGIPLLLFGGWAAYSNYKKHLAQNAMNKLARAFARLKRTYKVDDMRLFCSAMTAVF